MEVLFARKCNEQDLRNAYLRIVACARLRDQSWVKADTVQLSATYFVDDSERTICFCIFLDWKGDGR